MNPGGAIMTRRSGFVLLIGAVVLLQTGCWFGTGSTSDIRYEFSNSTGLALEPEFGVKLGRISTGFAKMFVKNHDEEISFKGVSKVEVGVYNVVDAREPAGPDLAAMELEGWVTIARVRDGDERVQVMCRPDGDRLRALLVLVLDGDELVVVRLKGRLEKFLPAALQKTGWADIGDDLNDLG
jgi:hypothetical protein